MVIVDTSVAYKWFNEAETDSNLALELLDSHLRDQNEIIIPDLLLYELANAWSTKGALDAKQIKDNLRLFKKYHLKVISVTFDLIEKAIELSKKNKISVYDASYAVVAQERNCKLVTADNKFVDQINLPFIEKLSEYKD